MKLTLFKKKKGRKIKKMISESNGEMEEGEREMIRGVVGLGETFVKTIMIPRTGVVSVSADMDFDDIISLVIKSGHSRIPVYEDTIDNVIGFLYAKDLLPYLAKKSTNKDYKNNGAVKKILRPVHFVPEGKMIDELLSEFRQKKMHIAVVVDEYGGMASIVCLENILEEIVGDIQDEYDDEEPEAELGMDDEEPEPEEDDDMPPEEPMGDEEPAASGEECPVCGQKMEYSEEAGMNQCGECGYEATSEMNDEPPMDDEEPEPEEQDAEPEDGEEVDDEPPEDDEEEPMEARKCPHCRQPMQEDKQRGKNVCTFCKFELDLGA
ncbi:hypothetical protein LCGC14_2708160 [marine sediment metagenome]|uniref:CBS domain-containing protein n=1 Tax=marine sediment metagenome TaxID=412755 RepID=A0A0F9C5K6_9ZZZZ